MKHILPLSLRLIRGAIGKQFVIKRYKYGKIMTKFPDMSRIIPSLAQRTCRDVFKEAVAYAKAVIADEHQKAAWQKRIRIRNGVYNAAIRYYMLKQKRAKENTMLEAQRLLRVACRNEQLLSNNDQQQVNPSLTGIGFLGWKIAQDDMLLSYRKKLPDKYVT